MLFTSCRTTTVRLSLVFLCAFLSHTTFSKIVPKTEHWIIIHGTFARSIPFIKWWKKGGDGYQALSQALSHKKESIVIHAFGWTGHNNHQARKDAARQLVKLAQTYLTDSSHSLHIVAHSHGGTVALLAAQMLAEQKSHLKIAQLFNLGTPVHAQWYPQAFSIIQTTYHLFSYGDMVQPVITMFERTLPAAQHIYNLQVKKDYGCPWHETLRSAELISQLPTLSALITEPGEYCLHLDTKSKTSPFFTISKDLTRAQDLEIDHAAIKQILTLYAESRKRSTL